MTVTVIALAGGTWIVVAVVLLMVVGAALALFPPREWSRFADRPYEKRRTGGDA